MTLWKTRVLVPAIALLSLAAAIDARAAGPDDRKAAAQVLFESGRSLLEQGHFAEACPKFAESQRLDPGLGTMLWLADCYESSGRLATGWAAFKEAAAAAAQRQDPREQVARDRASKLESRLSRLNILVTPGTAAPGLEVRRDGMLVGSAEWGLPIPLDSGVHSIAATAPGHRPWSTTVDIRGEAEVLPVTIPVLESEPAEGLPATPPPTTTPGGATQRTVGIAIAGTGIAGLVIGAIASLSAKATYDASNAGHCNASNACDAIGKQDRSSALSTATIATVAMTAGAAALIGGGLLYFMAPTAKGASVAIAPTPNGGAIRVNWLF